jgi:hypothetical protein
MRVSGQKPFRLVTARWKVAGARIQTNNFTEILQLVSAVPDNYRRGNENSQELPFLTFNLSVPGVPDLSLFENFRERERSLRVKDRRRHGDSKLGWQK